MDYYYYNDDMSPDDFDNGDCMVCAASGVSPETGLCAECEEEDNQAGNGAELAKLAAITQDCREGSLFYGLAREALTKDDAAVRALYPWVQAEGFAMMLRQIRQRIAAC